MSYTSEKFEDARLIAVPGKVFMQACRALKARGIEYDADVDDGKYLEVCPRCGEREFWSGSRCGHCDFTIRDH